MTKKTDIPYITDFVKVIRKLPNYEFRESQIQMVETIEKAIEENTHALIEAGTGSGKSFAYLFPLINSKKTTVISTGTIALQEQLLDKDIPFLKKSDQLPEFTAVIAKGRNNYVCKQKLFELERTLFPGSNIKMELELIIDMIDTWDGDFANLPFQISNDLKREIESSSEDCIMNKCEFFKENKAPFFNARKKIAKADLIITNHSLYLADIVSQGNVLPEHETVVFDEAHHLYMQSVNAFTIAIGRYSTTKLIQKIQKRVNILPENISRDIINTEAKLFEWIFSFKKPMQKLTLENNQGLKILCKQMLEVFKDLNKWLEFTSINLQLFPHEELQIKANSHKQNLIKQLDKLRGKWKFLIEDSSYVDRVTWFESDSDRGYFEIKSAPLFIDKTLNSEVWSKKSSIFTSATIAINNDFKYFRNQLGIEKGLELILSSPFDYKKQSALFIPENIPDPNADDFLAKCKDTILEALNITQGRAFLLFSSWKNMELAHSLLKDDLKFPFRKQGELTRKNLIEWFKKTPNSVLFATSTFWEGIDIPGDSLSCVIIDKLPFSVPDDPIIQAKVNYMKANDINWFSEFMLPEAIIKLRQGVGRLIRTKADKGILVILDSRINTKYYGKIVIRALPPVTRLKELTDAIKFLI
ncbi:MAG: ATP-dependent DNA helicase [Candidatus Sericytochromatia bacterium]|nr:ATP-dependent DNA helicase [Candidatus Sericytochromatia bacterium]